MTRTLPPERLRGLVPYAGLSSAEVAARRAIHGPNDVVESQRRSWRRLLRETAADPMLWFLAATSAAYFALGQRVEAAVLLAAMLPLVGMDALLHYRTAASTEGLSARLASRARVERDGVVVEVAASDLVPGDLVDLETGNWLPADGLLLPPRPPASPVAEPSLSALARSRDRQGAVGPVPTRGQPLPDGRGSAVVLGQVDESSLTGESFPVAKEPYDPDAHAAGGPVREESLGFAGTRLLTGRARLRVVWTGGETIYGEIVRSAVSGSAQRTPLQDAIANLVRGLLIGASAICAMLVWVRLRQGFGWLDALISGATLAVAALPEEFPVVFTLFLGVGVYRLAQRKALVRRAVSVENIGRVTCICSDKTGTITEGQLELTHLLPAEGVSEAQLLATGARASRGGSGDPLDDAIRRLSAPPADEGAPAPAAVFPFTEGRKRETVIVARAQGGWTAYTKGAGELVLAMTDLGPEDRRAWDERLEAYAREGHKLIGCAWRDLDDDWAGGEPDRGYRWAGLLAFEDPVRAGVVEAVSRCREAGVRVVLVTGDHPATAAAVAREIGLGSEPTLLTGDQLDALLERGDGEALGSVAVIARAVPAQKVGLVRALQAQGEIVAVTGDGVNDVPALQSADVGIAMGQRGTRSAREAAAIVLLDDNFRSIARAIGEGQQLFANLRRSFAYLLMIHLPLVLTAAVVPLAGFPLLYLPLHIVWLELVIHPSAMLAFQERAAALRIERHRQPRGHFFNWRDWLALGCVGALVTALVLVRYVLSLEGALPVEHARANALASLTLASAALVAGLSRLRTASARWIAAATVLSTVVLIETPGLSALLHLQALHATDWLRAALGAAAAGLLAMRVLRSGPGRSGATAEPRPSGSG